MTPQGRRMMDEGRQTPDNAKGMAQAHTVELNSLGLPRFQRDTSSRT